MNLFQDNSNPGQTVVKRTNSRKRDSISSARSNLTYATPPEISLTKPEATGGVGKQVSGSLTEHFAAADMWRLSGQYEPRHVSRGQIECSFILADFSTR